MTRPETPERATQELTLRLALGPVLMATQGYTAPEVAQFYSRARVLCEQLANSPQLFPVLYGLWVFHAVRGELRTAQSLAQECLRIAKQTNEEGVLVEAHFAVGSTSLWRGEFSHAHATYEQGVAYYQSQQHQALIALYGGYDPGVTCLCHVALVLWYLGYPEQAMMRSHEALRLAQDLGHFLSLAFSLTFAAWLHLERGEEKVAQERADAAIALSSEHGFPYWEAWGLLRRGGALIKQDRFEEGQPQIDQGVQALRVGELVWTYSLALLAEGARTRGQAGEGLAAVAEALTWVDKNDERFYEAELYRIKGELLLAQEGFRPQAIGLREKADEAEACFLKAIDIAQKQQAKSLELRAVMSLARLWQRQGKTAEARQRLAEIYGWFTEGFDTKDLQEAKALLAELQSQMH